MALYFREGSFICICVNIVFFIFTCNAQYDDTWSDCPKLYPRNFIGYTPRGNLTAGNYTEKVLLKGIKQCVMGCCTSETCNVVFMHDSTCYHIECASNELCLPLYRSENPNIGNHVSMVLVSPTLEDESWQDILLQSKYGSYQEIPNLTLEDELINNFANTNRRIEGVGPDSTIENIIKYKNQFNPDVQDGDVLSHFSENMRSGLTGGRTNHLKNFLDKSDQLMDASEDFTEKLINVNCEDGIITDCPVNEECVRILPKSRSGICKCIEGYVRNLTGVCVLQSISGAMAVPYSMTKGNLYTKDIEANKSKKDDTSTKPDATSTETSSKPTITKLTVSVLSKEVRLPENEVTLSAFTIPDEKTSNDHYNYVWTLVDQPKGGFTGNMKEQNSGSVTLSQLTEGKYSFKVAVSGSTTNSFGEAYANVTVLPPNRINKPPVVVISPPSQTVKLPNTGAVLDGSDSKDDDAIISWHWELISGPLGYQPPLHDGPTLQLTDLKQTGNYTFRLIVEDSDHVQNSTTANITVLNHTDYPPEANAGQDIIIYLPKNNLTLNGSLSTDDHEITTWEWTKSSQDQDKAVDMQNTHSPYLQLSNLSEGMYTFVLKVTDSSGQSSTADVHVFVKPPTNTPPKAVAGKHQYVSLPVTWVTLNGTESTDDHRIVAYTWKVLKGPNNATLTHNNESITNLTSLTKGEYEIQLTVLDDNGNFASDTVGVTVTQNKNAPPKANAGGDQTIVMPVSVVILNGSQSHDDLRVARWQWERQSSSLAAGKIVWNSATHPVLLLSDVVPGRYLFSLTVWDDQGLSDTDSVSINIKPNPNKYSLVELTLNVAASALTYGQITSLEQKMGLLLGEGYNINITDVRSDQLTTRAQVIFYVTDKRSPQIFLPGPEVVANLKSKLRRDASLLELNVGHIDTVVCQNNCSGHGVCHEPTRQCHCEAFWMQNILTPFMDDMEPNCDWSILYVVVGALVLFLTLVSLFWGFCCLIQKLCTRKNSVHRRVARYTLLGGGDEEETTRFTPNKTIPSDSDTDSDVLFESRNKSRFGNGDSIKNGSYGKGILRNGSAKTSRIKT